MVVPDLTQSEKSLIIQPDTLVAHFPESLGERIGAHRQ